MKIVFIAKGIKEVKTNISKKSSIDFQAERFAQDMLAKHDLLFKKVPYGIGIYY